LGITEGGTCGLLVIGDALLATELLVLTCVGAEGLGGTVGELVSLETCGLGGTVVEVSYPFSAEGFCLGGTVGELVSLETCGLGGMIGQGLVAGFGGTELILLFWLAGEVGLKLFDEDSPVQDGLICGLAS